MSLYFDLVINCDLKEDTPASVIEAVKSLTDTRYEPPKDPQLSLPWDDNGWNHFWNMHFLAPWQDDVVSFKRQLRAYLPRENNRPVYRYSLKYMGRNLKDDLFFTHHYIFFYWLAIVSYQNFFGYYQETADRAGKQVKLLYADKLLEKLNE